MNLCQAISNQTGHVFLMDTLLHCMEFQKGAAYSNNVGCSTMSLFEKCQLFNNEPILTTVAV